MIQVLDRMRMMTDASIMFLLALVVFVTVVAGVIFIHRRIMLPLADISSGLRRIAAGKLDQTVTVRGRGEIAKMGEMVNDIAANQQEVLLHLWTQTDHTIDLIDRLSETVRIGIDNGSRERVHADLKALRSSMKDLKGLTEGVSFYNVHLEGKSAVIPDPKPKSKY
jgi:methyl-accepting chemotaxis protein